MQSLEMICSHQINPLDTLQSLPYLPSPRYLILWATLLLTSLRLCCLLCVLSPVLLCLLTSQFHVSSSSTLSQKCTPPHTDTHTINASAFQEFHIQTSSLFISIHFSYVSWSIPSYNFTDYLHANLDR